MFTTLLIVVTLFLMIISVRTIITKQKKRYPEKSDAENEKTVQQTTSAILYTGLLIIVVGIIYFNFFYKTSEEKKVEQIAENKKNQADAKIRNEQELFKKFGLRPQEIEILNQHKIEIKNIDDEVKNAYQILKSQEYYIDTEIIRFTGLAKKIKESKYLNKVVKTRDSLVKNQSQIEKKQSEEYDRKHAKEESKSRKNFETEFQNKLLDKELNIKVKVFGKDNKKIKLTYVLFTDVWFRKFETEGYFDDLHQRGFTHIELTDGYDYYKGIKYDE